MFIAVLSALLSALCYALASVLPAVRRTVREFDPQMDVWDARTMDAYVDKPLTQPRLSALLMTTFSLVALLLSATGLYGVISSAVRQQTRDIGVRVARRDVVSHS